VGTNELSNAFLIIGSSKIFLIKKHVIYLGRSRENDLILDFPQISRKHAELQFAEGCFYISDLNSMGGTFVNGDKITRKKLEKGDIITLANLHLVFGQDVIPESATNKLYETPNDSEISEQDTKSFVSDDSEHNPDTKSVSY